MKRICNVCDCPQFPSPSGWVCRNGHGGAGWYPGYCDDYHQQQVKWARKINKERKDANEAEIQETMNETSL